MKITSIDVMKLNFEGANQKSRGAWSPIIVRINTDEGISGFGEVGVAYGKGWRAGFGMVQDFAEQIIGMDPMNIEQIWESIFRKTFWGCGGGTIVSAGMSGIDIALWDIKGKALGVPVWQLMGGKTNDNLRTYASQIQFNWEPNTKNGKMITPEDYYNVTKKAMSDGYNCVKVDPLWWSDAEDGLGEWKVTGPLEENVLRTGYERMKAIREAGGPGLDIIIELHSFTDSISAVQFAKKCEDLRIFYLEEPTHSMSADNMLEVRKGTSIPVAAGERIYTRWGYKPFLEKHAIQVIQPDICLCGGLTEAKKISDMANTYDCAVQIHVCGSPISKAAALQIEAVIPNFIIHEHHQRALDPAQIATCLYDYQPVNGKYKVPDLPGIGQELTPEAIANSDMVTVSEYKPYRK